MRDRRALRDLILPAQCRRWSSRFQNKDPQQRALAQCHEGARSNSESPIGRYVASYLLAGAQQGSRTVQDEQVEARESLLMRAMKTRPQDSLKVSEETAVLQ